VSSDGGSDRLPRYLGRGALTSLFVHVGLLFPLVTLAFILGAREEARRAQEVELTFESVDPADLPPDLPPIDPEPRPPEKREALAMRPEPPQPPVPEQPPPPKTEEPPPPPTPPAPRPDRHHEKSVEIEIDKEEAPDPNARFLAEKNNRVAEETRAERTNLERQQKGEESSSSPSERADPAEGDPEDKIARLEERKSKLGRRAPDVTPHEQESLPRSAQDRKSLLSMRETAERRHQLSPETIDPSLPRDPNGVLPMPEEDLQSMKDLPGRGASASRASLRLSGKQYEYLFGDDAEAAERFAQKEMSKKQGRFANRLARVQSALENFIPEVRPGNQTALNTRAAPFAAFIARMHRSIHELWGFGFLEDLEQKPASSQYNDRTLVSKLEIVMNGDGTVDKVTVIRPSGYLPYDVAAIDVVYSAGPYVDPPRAIRSRNGKIYVHWTFHRDERQCATSGVDYYILDNPPAGGDIGESPAPGVAPGVPNPVSPRGAQAAAPGGEPEPQERGLRRLERGLPGARGSPGGREAPAEEAESAEPAPVLARRAAEQVVRSDDPAARGVAEQWFDAYVKGDIGRMVRMAVYPFKSIQGVAARGPGELGKVFRELVAEAPPGRRARALQIYSAAGARRVLGGIPPGFEDLTGLLFAVGHVGGDSFVLVLSQQSNQWRAIGLIRN
jgi:hypothetical protein